MLLIETLWPRATLFCMAFTARDLQLIERHLEMLEGFIARHRHLAEELSWPAQQKTELEKLLRQFEIAAREARERRQRIWDDLLHN